MKNIIRRWYDMIRINSINGHEVDLADYIANELKGMGLTPHYIYFDEDREKVRPSLWTELDSGRTGKTMMLVGHIDTVGIANGWKTDPFTPTEEGDRVYGLGAMDMKGGLAAVLETLEYYVNHKDAFQGKLRACFLSDEEGLSAGAYQLMKEGVTADYAIMAECRYDNVAVGFRGRFSFEVTVHGEAAHTSRYPQVGVNALISAGKMAEAIEALPTKRHPKLNAGTWCVRHIHGGNMDTLVVPDTCELFVDRFVVPGEDEEGCIAQIYEAAKSIGLEGKVDVRLKPRVSPYMKSFALEEDHILLTTLRKTFTQVTGGELPVSYDPSCCDSNILAVTGGIPVVTFGPSGGGMHSANEYGHPYQVENCAEIYRLCVEALMN